jgi:hypothetical protein
MWVAKLANIFTSPNLYFNYYKLILKYDAFNLEELTTAFSSGLQI